ncbi:hypothetical protein [Kineococcus aurantiacus]|uniref:hypothetical protein n=1 Tax=Kineococcus aurantiacus TaxID=37633 RepID=UPI0031E453B0
MCSIAVIVALGGKLLRARAPSSSWVLLATTGMAGVAGNVLFLHTARSGRSA